MSLEHHQGSCLVPTTCANCLSMGSSTTHFVIHWIPLSGECVLRGFWLYSSFPFLSLPGSVSKEISIRVHLRVKLMFGAGVTIFCDLKDLIADLDSAT